MHAHMPPFTRVNRPRKADRVVCDPELGGLKHVLLQMEDETAQIRAKLVQDCVQSTRHGHGTSVYQCPPNCDDSGESETVGEYMDRILAPPNCDGLGPYN